MIVSETPPRAVRAFGGSYTHDRRFILARRTELWPRRKKAGSDPLQRRSNQATIKRGQKTMTLTIQLTPEQEARLRERAARQGQDATDYARSLIDKGLTLPTLDEILAPIRQDFRDSGMSEVDLENLIEGARDAVYRERHSPKAS